MIVDDIEIVKLFEPLRDRAYSLFDEVLSKDTGRDRFVDISKILGGINFEYGPCGISNYVPLMQQIVEHVFRGHPQFELHVEGLVTGRPIIILGAYCCDNN